MRIKVRMADDGFIPNYDDPSDWRPVRASKGDVVEVESDDVHFEVGGVKRLKPAFLLPDQEDQPDPEEPYKKIERWINQERVKAGPNSQFMDQARLQQERQHEDLLRTHLERMDHYDDSQWNKDGSPNLNHLSKEAGRTFTKDVLQKVAPELRRNSG